MRIIKSIPSNTPYKYLHGAHFGMKLIEISNVYSIQCDMDGVLADFEKKVKEVDDTYNREEYLANSKARKSVWDAITQYQKDGGELWYELDMMPDAMVLWDYISKYPNTEILTATGNPMYHADEQKIKWVKERIGNVKVNFVRKSADKAQWAAPNHILIDDAEKSIVPWTAAGGIGILHTSAKDTINKLKEIGL